MINCPECDREWPDVCEQAMAIKKRNMCIVCLVQTGQSWETDPYEFEVPKEDDL